ncbi:MAG: HEPN domain-containing protein [Phycisphaerae bacterium]|nr:HEPN domain-containing protein [Phycisphaerae bacterium]
MPPKYELVQRWLVLAQKDLAAAEILVESQPPLLEQGCFYCQQCVEKALKAVLIMNEIKPPRTHDIAELINRCVKVDARFEICQAQPAWLTSFAVDTRYPDTAVPLTVETARRAVESAKESFSFILSCVPGEVHP